jgi:hypothetical protein
MYFPTELIILIFQFCEYSNDLRITKRFSSILDIAFYPFYHEKFVYFCVEENYYKINEFINKVNSDTLSYAFLSTLCSNYGNYKIRSLLIQHKNFKPYYQNRCLLVEVCKRHYCETFKLLLKFKYDENIINECYEILNNENNKRMIKYLKSYNKLNEKTSQLI